jgi:hypothetical protein
MGKVEIKIRKKILTPDNLQQYRDYPALLKKYERNKRFKRALRIFIYSLALTLFVLALIFLGMWKVLMDKKQEETKPQIHKYALIGWDDGTDTLIRTAVKVVVTDSCYILSYQQGKNNTTVINLPINPIYNTKSINWFDEKSIRTNSGEFKVIKYLYDLEMASDEESFYFYSPEYGMILERSIVWGNYIRSTDTGNAKKRSNNLSAYLGY